MAASNMSFILTLALAFTFTSASPMKRSDEGNPFGITLDNGSNGIENPFEVNHGDDGFIGGERALQVRHDDNDCHLDYIGGVYYWTSPHFDEDFNYPRNVNCTIRGSTVRPLTIKVDFIKFRLQNEVSGDCVDYVMFKYPGGKERKLCGNEDGTELVLPYFNFEAVFFSDASGTARGFNISLELQESVCHKVITLNGLGDTGDVGSFHNPLEHPSGKGGCEYWIIAPEDLFVKIEFLSVDMRNGCQRNNLVIDRDGRRAYDDDTSEVICPDDVTGGDSSTYPSPIFSIGNEIDLVYTYSNSAVGFRVQYTAVDVPTH